MVANITSRIIGLTIGSDTQDWSDAGARIEIGRDAIGQSGILAARGTLTIQEDLSNPESIRPLNNPERWRPGQPIALQVANDSATLIDHPLGALYILKEPSFDYDSGILTVEIGDALAWFSSAEPSDDASDITVCAGTSVDLAVVAQRYLEAAGIASGNISLGTWGITVNRPIGKPSGSYVGKAGDIAYASGFRLLYVDKSGVVKAKQLDTAPGAADITITLGTNDIAYVPDPDPLDPFETVQVVGTGQSSEALTNPIVSVASDSSTELYKFQEYDLTITELGGPNGSSTSVTSGDYIKLVKRERLKQRKDELVADSSDATKIVAYDKYEIRYYEKRADCQYRLYYIFRYNEAAEVTFKPDDDSDIPVRTEEETETYTYNDDDQCIKISIQKYAREDLYDPDGGITRRLVVEAVKQWVKRGTDLFDYEETEKQAAILVQPDREFDTEAKQWRLIPSKPPIVEPATQKGKNTPPRSEYWTQYADSEEAFEGSATWVHRGGATGRDRTRPPYQIAQGLAFSTDQCNGLAAKHRDLLDGRKRQHRLEFPITNALLAIDEPFPRIDVVDGAVTRQYLADALTWIHEQGQSYVECLGIEVSARDVIDGTDDVIDGSDDVVQTVG